MFSAQHFRCLAFALGLALNFNSLSASEPPPRAPWIASRLTGSPNPPPPYIVETAYPALKFSKPVEMVSLPGSDRLFILEEGGQIHSFRNRSDAARPDLFIDLRKNIPKLGQSFGLAFHPDFATNRLVYICYVLQGQAPDASHVSRFKVTATEPPTVDPASEQIIITWRGGGHNGGSIHFGPDGMLYISTGDSADPVPPDPLNTGQDISDLLSSILRIDVDHAEAGRAYHVPADNPFVNTPGARPEVWAYGFRNPWRMSFDSVTGDLWTGDVGWDLWEMIHRVERGGNYGWSIMEGPQPVKPNNPRGPTPIIPPVVAHSHSEARSITGGRVYHGSRLPGLQNAYIYGDYMTGRIWGLRHNGKETTWRQELAVSPLRIVCFGADQAGELYIVDYGAGTIHRLVPNHAAGANSDFPKLLSETGIFSSTRDQTPATGVFPYRIRSELWSDGAVAERWVAAPGTNRLPFIREDNWDQWEAKGGWRFPTDGVLVKTLSLELKPGDPGSRRRLETQVLHFDGRQWQPYVFRWNDEQTDAVLSGANSVSREFQIADPAAPGGQRRQTWHHASTTECVICHNTSSGGQFGFMQWQLDHPVTNAARGTSLEQLINTGLLNRPNAESNLVATADLNGKVRAYFDVNCSHCHRPGGGGTATIDLRLELSLKQTGLIDQRPSQGDFGLTNGRIISPGHPERSVLLYRLAKLGSGHMPQFGSSVPDIASVRMIRDWIAGLDKETSPSSVEWAALKTGTLNDATIGPLVQSPSRALVTSLSLDDPSENIPLPTRSAVVQLARASGDSGIRDVFERFIPEEQRAVRLGTSIKPAELLALKGRADLGRKVFFEIAQCAACHQIKGEGKAVGPDLVVKTAQKSRAEILENILEPSKVIEPEYIAQLVETKDGETLTGFLREKTSAGLVIRDTTGQDIRLKTADVRKITPQKLSLMPEGLLQNLTAQEAADLLEFVAGLGRR